MNGETLPQMSREATVALQRMRAGERVVEFRLPPGCVQGMTLSHIGAWIKPLEAIACEMEAFRELARHNLVLMHDQPERVVFILKSRDSKGSPT